MKKKYAFRCFLAAWMMCAFTALMGCAANTDSASSDQAGSQSAAQQSGSNVADLNDGVTKIALLISGDLGDMSFWDSAASGMKQFATDHPDVVVDIIEMGSSDATKYESTLNQTANADYDLIIVGSPDMREPLQRCSTKSKYADRRFILFDTEIKDDAAASYPSVHSIMFSQNEGGYLAGLLAAKLSAKVGAENTAFIGGTKNDIINDFAYGFMQGVQASNEADGTTIRAYNSYIGDFTNSPKGSRLASDFYESGVEVLFAAASQAGLGCIDSAKANGRLIIGVDSDQYAYYQQSDPEKAACIVTSVLKRVDLALYDCCERFMAGTLTYGDLDVLGIADGMIGLVENENYTTIVPQQIRDDITDAARQIAAGELSVASGLKRYTAQDTLNALFDKLDPTK